MSWYVRGHCYVCTMPLAIQAPPALPRHAGAIDADALVVKARRAIDADATTALAHQAPPHVWAWADPEQPGVVAIPRREALVVPAEREVRGIQSARPESVGLGIAVLEPRLYDAAYVLWGAATVDIHHAGPAGRGHRVIGRAQLARFGGPRDSDRQALAAWSDRLGVLFAQLHFGLNCDGNSAWVVIGHTYYRPAAELWLTVDASRCAFGRDAADATQRVRSMMLLPLIPQPLEAPDLFAAFTAAYARTAYAYGAGREAEGVIAELDEWDDSAL